MQMEGLVTIFIHQTNIWVLYARYDSQTWFLKFIREQDKTFTLKEFNSSNTEKNNTDKK